MIQNYCNASLQSAATVPVAAAVVSTPERAAALATTVCFPRNRSQPDFAISGHVTQKGQSAL